MSPKHSAKQIKATVDALNAYREKPFVKHQWEELVYYLSRSSDHVLRERMSREMIDLLAKDPGCSSFQI